MSKSEKDTNQQIIDKRLAKGWWNVKDPSQVTEELDIIVGGKVVADPKENYKGHQFADYIFLRENSYHKFADVPPKPMLVLECGRNHFPTKNSIQVN